MHDDPDHRDFPIPLTGDVADVLRKHLGRGTLSLDDAAILMGVSVEAMAHHFQGRRSARGQRVEEDDEEHPEGYRRRHRASALGGERLDAGDARLHAPERRTHHQSGGNRAWWVGGILAGVAVLGGLAVLSGIPQSLLFAPRGVSQSRDINAPAEAALPAPSAEIPLTAEAALPPAAEAPVAAAEPAAVPETPADPATDPMMADPNAAPPPVGTVPPADAIAEAPVPAAPEEVAPATAVSETETAFDAAMPAPAAPPLAAPVPASPIGGALLYATRQAVVRDTPTATGSATVGQLKRGESVSGSVVAGADGKLSWLKIESGPAAGGYVSIANMASDPRPAIVQTIGQPRTVVQAAPLHAGPSDATPLLDTLNPGINVLAAAEVEGGWIEIQKRAGGVGYIRKEAFE